MAVDAAFVALRAELLRLRESLRAVRTEARRKCPDRTHCIPTRLDDVGPELRGLLRVARSAAGLALAAVEGPGGGVMPRMLLSRCERAMRKLRRAFREHVAGRNRMADLADLARRADLTPREHKRWKKWVRRLRPAILTARKQIGAVRWAVAGCWRELAAVGPLTRITITNVAIGQQVVGPRPTEAREPPGEPT